MHAKCCVRFSHVFSHLILTTHCEVCTTIPILLISSETGTRELQPLIQNCSTCREVVNAVSTLYFCTQILHFFSNNQSIVNFIVGLLLTDFQFQGWTLSSTYLVMHIPGFSDGLGWAEDSIRVRVTGEKSYSFCWACSESKRKAEGYWLRPLHLERPCCLRVSTREET